MTLEDCSRWRVKSWLTIGKSWSYFSSKQASNESNPITYFRSIEKQISKGQGSEADVGKEDEKVVGFFHRSHATAQWGENDSPGKKQRDNHHPIRITEIPEVAFVFSRKIEPKLRGRQRIGAFMKRVVKMFQFANSKALLRIPRMMTTLPDGIAYIFQRIQGYGKIEKGVGSDDAVIYHFHPVDDEESQTYEDWAKNNPKVKTFKYLSNITLCLLLSL